MRVYQAIFLTFGLLMGLSEAIAGSRVALIIGNADYREISPLKNTINDAKAIDTALRSIGFDTQLVINSTERGMKTALRSFSKHSEGADTALVFYAGHGAQVDGKNYILPIDIELPQSESDIALQSLDLDTVLDAIRARVKVVILDACRDNPALSRSMARHRGSIVRGLAPPRGIQPDSIGGVFIAYSTEAGNVALDGDGTNSPFTRALVEHITKPVSIDDMFSMVTRDVRLETKSTQTPFKYASLDGIICLTARCNSLIPSSAAVDVESSAQASQPPAEASLSDALIEATSPFEIASLALKADGKAFYIALDRIWSLSEESFPPFTPFESSAEREEYFRFLPRSRKSIGNDRVVIAVNSHELKKTFIFTSKKKLTNWMVIDCAKSEAGVYMNQALDGDDMPLKTTTFGNPANMHLQPIPVGSVLQHLKTFVCEPLGFARIFDEVENTSAYWELVSFVSPGVNMYIGRDIRTFGNYKVGYFSTRSEKPIEMPNFGFSYTMLLQRYTFDCVARTGYSDLEYIDEAGAMVAKTNAYGPNKSVPIPKESVLEILFNKACAT